MFAKAGLSANSCEFLSKVTGYSGINIKVRHTRKTCPQGKTNPPQTNTRKTISETKKTMSYVGKTTSDIGKTTSDLFFAFVSA